MDVDEPHLLGEPRAGPGAVSGVAGDGHKDTREVRFLLRRPCFK